MTVGAVPVVLGAVGFTGAGITASSLAAKMMSVSAIANGGGVAAGSLVATLQSVGKCSPAGREGRGPQRVQPGPSPASLCLCAYVTLRVLSLEVGRSPGLDCVGPVGSAQRVC